MFSKGICIIAVRLVFVFGFFVVSGEKSVGRDEVFIFLGRIKGLVVECLGDF